MKPTKTALALLLVLMAGCTVVIVEAPNLHIDVSVNKYDS